MAKGIQTDAKGHQFYAAKDGKKFYLGLKRTAKSRAFLKTAPRAHVAVSTIPSSFDLTPKVSPPEDQGQCGSCWDFGITKALRSALMLVGKDPGVLAFNFLLNNCGKGPSQGGCGGGDFDAGQSFLNAGGPWLESQDPYTQQEGRCKSGLSVAGTALTYVAVGSGSGAPSFQDLAAAVSQNHMLVIDVAVAGSWGSYSGGIYNGNGSGINHIINMVGYDCETSKDASGNCVFNAQGQPVNGDGFLKVMNNWGSSWGENGYMRTRWGKNQIAETAMYFEVQHAAPVNGGWSDWSVCANGMQSRTCTNPAPSNGGVDCAGSASQSCVIPPPPPVPGAGIDWALVLYFVVGVVGLAGGFVLGRVTK